MKVNKKHRIKDEGSIVVIKYGGSSLKTKALFMHAANNIANLVSNNKKVALIVSAQGSHTNELIKKITTYAPKTNPREYDAHISTGEIISATLMAATLINLGISAYSLNPYQAKIRTTGHYKNSRIISVDSDNLLKLFSKYDVLVIPGFQGIGPDNSITTLGRGGSDTTAVAVAYALNVGICNILTDVKGIYTTHPKKILNITPKIIPQINYEEVCEMSSLGAEIIHPKAVQIAAKNQILIRIAHSSKPDDKTYTIVGPFHSSSKNPVTAACIDSVTLLTLSNISKRSGEFPLFLSTLYKANLSISLVIHNITMEDRGTVDVVIPEGESEEILFALKQYKNLKDLDPTIQRNFVLISIVGQGMENMAGISSKLLNTISDCNSNIRLLSSSSISLNVLIPKDNSQEAYEAVCNAFKLI